MIEAKAPLDLVVQITTPENIRFDYRLAGPFRRGLAAIVDFVVRLIVIVVISFLVMLTASFLGLSGLGSLGASFGVALIFILYFLFTWFYGLFFEAYMNGQTPGKRLSGLRVISSNGRPINGVQATIRNFLRVADTAPVVSLEILSPEFPPAYIIPTFLIALIAMGLTKKMQRLGDLAAGTMVVVDERNWFPKFAKFEDPRVASLSEFIPANFRMSRKLAQALALYVDRRRVLSPARRAELASLLAVPLIRRFGFREDTSPDLTLCALYYRDFIASDVPFDSEEVGLLSRSSRNEIPSPYGSVSPDFGSKFASPTQVGHHPTQSIEVIEAAPILFDPSDSQRSTTEVRSEDRRTP